MRSGGNFTGEDNMNGIPCRIRTDSKRLGKLDLESHFARARQFKGIEYLQHYMERSAVFFFCFALAWCIL